MKSIVHNEKVTGRPLIDARRADIDPEVTFGENCRIEADEITIGRGVHIGRNFNYRGESLTIADNTVIGDEVTINVALFRLGYKSRIENNCRLAAIRGRGDTIVIGDYTFIGHDSTLLIPELHIGDYSAVHNHLLLNGYAPCIIGHNCYVGQHSVLNASEKLTIGNNVRLALNGYIWTHVESGELLEGCNFYGRSPVTIEDNVWLTGCNISVSPGVTLRDGSIVMHGSVVTRSTEPRRCYSGVPAVDVTDKLKPYHEVTHDEKFERLKQYAEDFYDTRPEYRGRVVFVNRFPDNFTQMNEEVIIIAKNGEVKDYGDRVTSIALESKRYVKKRTELEEAYIRFHLGARARFIPA